MKVTVCQMPDDRKAFERDWSRLAKHVRKEKSDLVLLPEMPFHGWFCFAPRYDAKIWREAVGDHTKWVGRLSELGASAVLGSRPVERSGKRLNEGFAWTEKGGARGVHDKGYLPNEEGYYEARWYRRGDGEFVPFDVSGLKAGMMICSDIWAMPHARAYGKAGAHLIAVPHAAPSGSMDRWLAAGRVVAMVSGAYCIASNRAGGGNGVEFGGMAWIITPEGEVVGTSSDENPFVTAEVSIDVADEAKKTYPRDALRPD